MPKSAHQLDQQFEFAPDDNPGLVVNTTWKILSVEDDPDYQASLVASLSGLSPIMGHNLQILTASSSITASTLISQHPDIGLILLDVVMEQDDAGLRLVSTIREVLGNASVRVVLLTGQPGFAPEKEVMRNLDIDGYWNKAELTRDKLHSVVHSNFRTWLYLNQLIQARQGLQLVLDAARSINSKHDLVSFTRAVLAEISHILGIDKGGIMCVGNAVHDTFDGHYVISSTGSFEHLQGLKISDVNFANIYTDMHAALEQKQHVLNTYHSIFYFETQNIDHKCYLMVVESDSPVNEAHKHLLQVFSENISSGFTNIALLNRLTELAYTDINLNIPNRNWLYREINNMSVKERNHSLLLMLEVNQFDEAAFAFGADFCQKLLLYVYKQICSLLPQSQRIALTASHRFSILLKVDEQISEETFNALAHQKIDVSGVEHSVDLTLLQMDLDCTQGYSAAKVINLAESSLREAKSKFTDFIKHTKQESDTISRRYDLMRDLRTAIGERTLEVMLQPKVNLNNNQAVGFEALARWKKDDGSYVSPDEFISIAEKSGLIQKLDCLIFEKTVEAIKTLYQQGYHLPVAFNASSLDLVHPDYFDFIINTIEKNAIPAHLLELEVTETQAMCDYNIIQVQLNKFIDFGLKISIDDFGTGYSSLEHISRLKAHYIKIDRSFVSRLGTDDPSAHIVEMVMLMCKKLNFKVIAEGIETERQKQLLQDMQCDMGQGYLFAKPMYVNDVLTWLKK